MARVVLYCEKLTVEIEDKILNIEDGTSVRLGRCHKREAVLSCNGLFPVNLCAISYHHAVIIYTKGEFYIQDTSRNGTYVNGYRIEKHKNHPLVSGDVIQLAAESFSSNVSFRFPVFHIKLFRPEDRNFEFFTLIKNVYQDPIHLQNKFPNFDCDLQLLHMHVMERFRVLQILDSIGDIMINKNNQQPKDILITLKDKCLLKMLKLITGVSETFEEEFNLQKMDHISHYILCMSCCKNYILKKWFIDQEVKLLKIRWHFLHHLDKAKLILNSFYNLKLNFEEKQELVQESNGYIDGCTEYFKIPLMRVSGLVKTRNVLLKNGYCYVERNDLIHALITDTTKLMKTNLVAMQKNLHRIWYDERITSIIHYIMQEIDFDRYLFDKRTGSVVVLSEIDKLAYESFPLCMNELHYRLKKIKHLKNLGRLQYGLFLKGIGLSMQDSVIFWRHYFTKKITPDEFVKKYQYHILHSYGTVGKMADYPPQSCKRILQAVPSYGEYHGCPYKVLQDDDLVPLLNRNKINDEGVNQILEIMKKGMPQLACKVYFDSKHNSELDEAPYHPNRYFDASREIFKLKNSSSIGKRRETNQSETSACCSKNKKYDW